MNRKEFLALIGMSAGAYAISRCSEGCRTSASQAYPSPPTNVNFTLDLWLAPYAALNNNGGYVYYNGIIVARVNTNTFIAVSEYCTHQGTAVIYQPGNNDFYCSAHSATFADSGAVVSGPAAVALQQYNTKLIPTNNGNSVQVTSI
jgi:cytochrome b6-f complex iron-sulfur subunit